MSKSIADMAPDAQGPMLKFVGALQDAGIRGVVVWTKRTALEQLALWVQGRASEAVVDVVRQHAGLSPISARDAANIVTKADGINTLSNHQPGRAMDWVPLRADGSAIWQPATPEEIATYKRIADIARACGLVCGQDWLPRDPVTGLGWDPDHYEVPAAPQQHLGAVGAPGGGV